MGNSVRHDPGSFEISKSTGTIADVEVSAVYDYKGQPCGCVTATVSVETGEHFDNMSYREAKDVLTRILSNYMFTEDYVVKCNTLQQNAGPFQKLHGLTFVEALRSGDLSLRILKLSLRSVGSFLKIVKKE